MEAGRANFYFHRETDPALNSASTLFPIFLSKLLWTFWRFPNLSRMQHPTKEQFPGHGDCLYNHSILAKNRSISCSRCPFKKQSINHCKCPFRRCTLVWNRSSWWVFPVDLLSMNFWGLVILPPTKTVLDLASACKSKSKVGQVRLVRCKWMTPQDISHE